MLNAAFALRGLTSGALLGGLMLVVFWKRDRARPVVSGMIAALLVMTAIQVLPKMEWSQPLWKQWIGPEIFWPWYTLIGTVVTLSVAWSVRALTKRQVPPTD